MSSPSTEQELRDLTSNSRVTWTMLSTATETGMERLIIALELDAFQGETLRNIALRHPDRAGNQGKFLLHIS